MSRRGRRGPILQTDGSNENNDPINHAPSNKRKCTSNRNFSHTNHRGRHEKEQQSGSKPQKNQKRNFRDPEFTEHHKKRFKIGFRLLEDWSKKDVHELLIEFLGGKTGFEELLESNQLTGDSIILVTKMLAKLCTSHFTESRSEIMSLASKDSFICSLQKYLFNVQLQDPSEHCRNSYFWKDVDGFFYNLSNICAALIDSIPTRACEVLPKVLKAIDITIEQLVASQGISIAEHIPTDFKILQERLNKCKEELEQKKKEAFNNTDFNNEMPPDNFRELDVYPSCEELLAPRHPFLRKNIIEGAYDSVDHYLDIQFRLLKEDFVAPLREGIQEFINSDIKNQRRMKFSNVKVHHHVEFICPYFSNDRAGVLLKFDFNQKQSRYHCRYLRRFMFGSLVCFTKDNFASILFGKVIERDKRLLDQKQIVVEFHPSSYDIEFNQPYIMVECSIYFEPYYHVLTALQNITETTFPMRKYLIDVNADVELPRYVNEKTMFNINDYYVFLAAHGTWPSPNQLHLDETQYKAFKSALTQKFSIIQGPPGTGKTYLGLQIVKTLIENTSVWYDTGTTQTPILVVCYTNHALDQFLEGLIGTTDDILRIGGQSKNEKLQAFNIRNKPRMSSQKALSQAFYSTKIELQHLLRDIKFRTDTLDLIEKYDRIINFNCFLCVDNDLSHSWFRNASNEEIITWLLGGRTCEARQTEQRQKELDKLMKDHDVTNTGGEQIDVEGQFDELLEEEHRNAMEDINEHLDSLLARATPTCMLSTIDILMKMQEIRSNLSVLTHVSDASVYNVKWRLETDLLDLQEKLDYLKMRLNEGRYTLLNQKHIQKPIGLNLSQPHHILPNDRWKLYFYWLNLYKTSLVNKLVELQHVYRSTYKRYMELKNMQDLEVMKRMLVVGMTTTGAARLQAALNTLQCRIVVVEEAAEVLESHVVVSITKACEQLILIGDHKQLRPSTATFKIDKDFKLGISLFERMVHNKIQCNVLGVQHRMRPEFAKLIVPTIYPTLQNHKSVENFPPIFGVSKNLYFITHDVYEQEAGDSSKANIHEASFLIALARYFIQNGYQPEDITILAAYSGQMFALWKLRTEQEFLLKDVRITVLDNYQGEESKIILLSLVRNNKEDKIGFLKNENRVCVALSRAKEGFFIIGNIDILCRNSTIWPKIKQTLTELQAIDVSLPLQCQLHPETITRVSSAKDFSKVPEGGCNKICGILLKCGHNCAQICHIRDRVHENTTCKIKCEKTLCKEKHLCQKMCYEECGKCQVLMKRLLLCSHEQDVPCFMDPCEFKCLTPVVCKLPCDHEVNNKPCNLAAAFYKCPFPCDTRVEPCGHSCVLNCHVQNDPDHLMYKCYKPCERARHKCSTGEHMCPKTCHEECPPCDIVIKKKRICSHLFDVACHTNADEIQCIKPCKKKLPCGHKCMKKCNEACGGCRELVNKQLPVCKHSVKTICSKEPSSKDCKGKCPKLLACGHQCSKRCNEPCTDKCGMLVEHKKKVDCGHKFKIPCHMVQQGVTSNSIELLQYCEEPCGAQLVCKHFCSGTCGTCTQGRIHITCQEKCGRTLVCGHECTTPCKETCQPCRKRCDFRCSHSKCKKRCGDICTECVENCSRKCIHRSCSTKCKDLCSVPPCTEPCKRKLRCGHNCVGFCGDPCPPLCRICNREELCEILFGTEDDEEARFVLLLECKHVIESEGMEQWLQQASHEIGYKRCPKCKTILSSTQRYSDFIKIARQDVINIKMRYFGTHTENETKRSELLQQLQVLSSNSSRIDLNDISIVIANLTTAIKPVSKQRRQPINMLLIDIFKAKIQIVERIVQTFTDAKLKKQSSMQNMLPLIRLFLKHLVPLDQRMTNQEIADFDRELNRLMRLAQLSQIEEELPVTLTPKMKKLLDEVKGLIFDVCIFTVDYDVTVKQTLLKLHKEVKSNSVLSEQERRQVVEAMGMASGHWFKCPNGHFYVIGECGGAMETSRCNECGERIGGSNHRLLNSNRHAGEVDNSSRAAWPPH